MPNSPSAADAYPPVDDSGELGTDDAIVVEVASEDDELRVLVLMLLLVVVLRVVRVVVVLVVLVVDVTLGLLYFCGLVAALVG